MPAAVIVEKPCRGEAVLFYITGQATLVLQNSRGRFCKSMAFYWDIDDIQAVLWVERVPSLVFEGRQVYTPDINPMSKSING